MISHRLHSILRRLPLCAAVIVLAALAAAPSAAAGIYRVYSCKAPDGRVMPTDGWSVEQVNTSYASFEDSCSAGGTLRATLWPQAQLQGARISMHFAAPVETEISGFVVWRSFRGATTRPNFTILGYLSWPSSVYAQDAHDACVIAFGCRGQGTQTAPVRAENRVAFANLRGVRDIYFSAACGSVYSGSCSPTSQDVQAAYLVQAFSADLRDVSNPVASDVGGTLTDPGSHDGVESLSYNARDAGSGVYRQIVELRRQGSDAYAPLSNTVVDANGGMCREIALPGAPARGFAYRVPCKLQASGAVDVDTRRIPNGRHDLRVSVEDAAGNRSTVYGPARLRVVNRSNGAGGPALLGAPVNGTNASDHARLRISKRTRRSRRLRFGQRLRSVTTLRDEHGRPISGARVKVLERRRVPGARWHVARKPLVSGSGGRLRWTIPAGTSRTIRLAYKANPDNTTYQSIADLRLTVRSRTSLRADRRRYRTGQTIHFSGRIRSRPIPRGGVLIDLQAYKPGTGWVTFGTKRSSGRGRWRIRYRLVSTSGTVRYRFRARVRQDGSYPYAASRSRVLRLLVRG